MPALPFWARETPHPERPLLGCPAGGARREGVARPGASWAGVPKRDRNRCPDKQVMQQAGRAGEQGKEQLSWRW